jgi:hypothetical protein
VIHNRLYSSHNFLGLHVCVVYNITELFSSHQLKCLQNHSVYSEVLVVTDDILVIVFFTLV